MPGWFIVNVADAPAQQHQQAGTWVRFEDPEARFPEFGINIHVLQPGQPNAKYHAESGQEDFLVLSGACTVILDGEERVLRAWDFVHCPGGTAHVFVGAGEQPCAILMVGARPADETVHYPVSELAARHGASVPSATSDAAEAYADWNSELAPADLPWPPS